MKQERLNKLRAAVLGANDGIISVSTALVAVIGVFGEREVFLTAVAVLLAGAISMAAGEYVSVSAQVNHELDDDETSLTDSAAPVQAAGASFVAFLAGGVLPAALAFLTHNSLLVIAAALALLVTSATLTSKRSARLKSTIRLATVGAAALGISLLGNYVLQSLGV